MNKTILPAFFPIVNIVSSIKDDVGEEENIESICRKAGLPCRVTGLSARRRVIVEQSDQSISLSRELGEIGSVRIKTDNTNPLYILGILAYGFNDYAARESVRGRGLFETEGACEISASDAASVSVCPAI